MIETILNNLNKGAKVLIQTRLYVKTMITSNNVYKYHVNKSIRKINYVLDESTCTLIQL